MLKALGHLLLFVINIYMLILFIRIVISWIRVPQKKWMTYIQKVTDPVINFFRKNTPIKIGMLDLSIIVLFLILFATRMFIRDILIDGRQVTAVYLLTVVVSVVNVIYGWISFLVIVVSVVLFFASVMRKGQSNPIIMTFRTFLGPVLAGMRKMIPINSPYADAVYCAILTIATIVLWAIVGPMLSNVIASLNTTENGMFQEIIEGSEETFDYEYP
jgi:uncharacterized protein YggT (Ycf19 family)